MNNTLACDVLIIGSGAAGLTTALKVAEQGGDVVIISSGDDFDMTNTSLAQGGIIYEDGTQGPLEELIEDIFQASAKTCNTLAAEILATKSGKILKEVLIDKAQTNFERSSQGQLLYTQEAAHSRPRIIYKGDYTGKEIQQSLLRYLKDERRFPTIKWLSSHTAVDLITPHHHGKSIQQRYEDIKVVGAYVLDQKLQTVKKIIAKKTVLATGGFGGLYLHSSNGEWSRGDGHAMARRAGAMLVNMEFVQFHPTTFYSGAQHRHFLISEAVRGEGGILLNSQGEAFMQNYHQDKELAPRDVVARAIWDELIRNKDDCVYLDISHKDREWLQNRFPKIYDHCLENGIDMAERPIPVVPAAHYTCGGVKVNLVGETSLTDLYAVGEVACTGLHGANRLASTSLLEGITFGHIAGNKILEDLSSTSTYDADSIKDWENGTDEVDLALIGQDILTIKQTMWNYLGLKRSKNRLTRARAMFRELSEEIYKFYKHAHLHDSLIGLRNSIEVAMLVLSASERNKDSVGCFYRE